MNKKKKDLFFVDASNLIRDIDFEVVTDTQFYNGLITHFYECENHIIDYQLVHILGLGVVKNLHIENDYYLYNASEDNLDNNFGFMNEAVRIGAYYQITHPNYDDGDLEKTIFGTKGGKEYIKLLQTNNTDFVLNQLKKIFESKKGKVISFYKSV